MIKPTIHMNGDRAATLGEGFLAVMSQISSALEAARQACPNGRNFYPQGPEAIHTAISEHEARLARLDAIRQEFEELATHCFDLA